MDTLNQWRCAIGTFRHPRAAVLLSRARKPCCVYQYYTFHARLLVMSLTLWGLYIEHSVLTSCDPVSVTYTNVVVTDCSLSVNSYITSVCAGADHDMTAVSFYYNNLILAGDIEANPGPFSDEDMKIFSELMKAQIQPVTSQLEEIKAQSSHQFDVVQTQMSSLSREVQHIKDATNSTSQRVDRIEAEQTASKSEIDVLTDKIAKLEIENEKQQQYSRRENVVFHGVNTLPGETSSNMRSCIVSFLNHFMPSRRWSEADIQRAHRLPANSQPQSNGASRPNPIIVRLHQFNDKLAILKSRNSFKQSGVGVSGDLTINQREKLKNLPEGKRGYFKNGKLVVVDKVQRRGVGPKISNLDNSFSFNRAKKTCFL